MAADQGIRGAALKRLAAEYGETKVLLFDALERLDEAQRNLARAEHQNKELAATIERLMNKPPAEESSAEAVDVQTDDPQRVPVLSDRTPPATLTEVVRPSNRKPDRNG